MYVVCYINKLINIEIEFNFYEDEVNMSSVWNNTLEKARKDTKLEIAENLFLR